MIYFFAGETELMGAEDHVVKVSQLIRYRLLSYYYHGLSVAGNKPSREARWGHSERNWQLFLDSGAFTAWTKKKVITCEQYAEYIHNSDGIWGCMSSLDAIGDPVQSRRNFDRLLQLGCAVCPVHHYGEPDEYLARYLAEGHPYIFIGGMVGRPRPILEGWLDHIWTNFMAGPDGSPRAKFHGFGLTDMHLCTKYPWYSVDSSSWLMTGNFGNGMFWVNGRALKVGFSNDHRNKDYQNPDSTHIQNLPPAQRELILKKLEDIGVTELQAQHYLYRNVVNASFYAELGLHGCERFQHQSLALEW